LAKRQHGAFAIIAMPARTPRLKTAVIVEADLSYQ
jgi:hypothetical protein